MTALKLIPSQMRNMTNFRQAAGTSIFAPRRGTPPKAPEGYITDKKDPYLYHKIEDYCKYREQYSIKVCCNRYRVLFECVKLGYDVTLIDCENCKAASKIVAV